MHLPQNSSTASRHEADIDDKQPYTAPDSPFLQIEQLLIRKNSSIVLESCNNSSVWLFDAVSGLKKDLHISFQMSDLMSGDLQDGKDTGKSDFSS